MHKTFVPMLNVKVTVIGRRSSRFFLIAKAEDQECCGTPPWSCGSPESIDHQHSRVSNSKEYCIEWRPNLTSQVMTSHSELKTIQIV